MSKQLTAEQADVVATAPTADILVVEAGAGTGKTSTLVELAKAMPGRGQYTAFNTSLVAESKTKFPQTTCPCNTIHSLAFRSEGRRFAHRLGGSRIRSAEVARMMGLTDMVVQTTDPVDGLPKEKTLAAGLLASQVNAAVRKFCQSADKEIGTHHFPRKINGLDESASMAVRGSLVETARRAWLDLSDPDGKLPYSHDCYVKTWSLNNPIISCDYLLIDEGQDLSPVMLSIGQQQVARGTKLIIVGDSAQQIYDFRGAVNALSRFPGAPRRMLSQSFRFGEAVALVANAVLDQLSDGTDLRMKGLPSIASKVARCEDPTAVLCRTNAAAVGHLLQAIKDGRRAHLIGGGADVVAFCEAAIQLQDGRSTSHPELACFESWTEVQQYVKTDDGEDLKLMVKLIDDFGADKIVAALKRMPAEKDADLVICTAHKSKGREWDRVKLASDFPTLDKSDDAALRLLYVACTRAKLVLDIEDCPPFCGGKDKDGNETPRIDVREARKFIPVAEPRAAILKAAAPTENTWSKGRSGDWLIRGKAGQTGQVTVVKKDGRKSVETIKKVVWTDDVIALYATK